MIDQYLLLDIKYQDLKKHFQNLQKEQASAAVKVKKKRQLSGGKNDQVKPATVDLCQFMGGISFKVPGRILKNQIALKATALANTGVNGSIFCNTMKALEVIKHCGAKMRCLEEPIPMIDDAGTPG